jgi:hypothetical protein
MNFKIVFKNVDFELLKKTALSLFLEEDGITYETCTADYIENTTLIHVNYPKIINIIVKLELFPKELNNIIDSYLIDIINFKYKVGRNVSFTHYYYDTSFDIHYCASGYINYEKIFFCFETDMDISDKNVYNCTVDSSNYCNSKYSFLQETINIDLDNDDRDQIQFENNINISDQIEFLEYYLEKKYNKRNYFIKEKYAYSISSLCHYSETTKILYEKEYEILEDHKNIIKKVIDNKENKNNIYYSDNRKICLNNKKKRYIIKRIIINEEHLLICAKIIKVMSNHTIKIAKMIKNIIAEKNKMQEITK